MQAKHTPGPWAISLSDDARVDDRITGANGATVVRGSIGYTPDAALIAAAPDMLEALRHALERFEAIPEHRDEIGVYRNAARIVRDAIARATGEA